VATVEDGAVTKLRGNPAHPFSRGELCPKVNRFVDRVYNPDRLLGPRIRTGPKGSGEFRDASWDEALAMVAEQVHEVIAEHGGEAVMPWQSAGTQGLIQMSSLDQRFFAKLGATRQTGSLCGATVGWGMAVTNGSAMGADPMDIAHSQLVILWGTNTRLTNRHLWPFIEKARERGAQIVVIDPIRTITAEAADDHIQPLPGTDIALMLAMMHVLIRDDLVDHDYVESHTTGYAELEQHVADKTPEWAATICGVDAATIEALARDYATVRPAMLRTLIGPEHYESGAMFFRTMACLPLLTGSWKELGGGVAKSVGAYAEPFVDHSVFRADHLAEGKTRRSLSMNHLGRNLTDATLAPPIHALFVWGGNPVVTVPGAELIRRGLEREDLFCVVSEQFMTDTARYADVVFPATTQLEHADVVESWGSLYVGWNEPAIQPLGEAVPNTELWRRLAKAMGFTEPELFEDDQSLIASATTTLDMEAMKRDGFIRLPVSKESLPFAEGGFGFPDGKARFVAAELKDQGLPTLPTYRPSKEGLASSDNDKLQLLTPKVHRRFINSSYSGLAGHGDREGAPYVELSRADATRRTIEEDDLVRVFNDRGSLELRARITDRLRPGVVAVPFGWWSEHHDSQSTANSLTSDTLTDWGGGVAYSDTLVEISPL